LLHAKLRQTFDQVEGDRLVQWKAKIPLFARVTRDGLHEPRASHLDLLAAVAGHRLLDRVYAEAVRARYLWHEFGDVNLLLP